MKINNTEFEYQIDYVKRKVHMLDMKSAISGESLANAMDSEFARIFIKQECLLQDIVDFDWIIYMSNGMIANFKDYNFSIISPRLPYLHKPYLDAMQQRRKGFGRG